MNCGGPYDALRDRMQVAPVALNPVGRGSFANTPTAFAPNGSKYRIAGANETQVCIDGEVLGHPEQIAAATFVLKRFDTPDDDPELVQTARSMQVTVRGSNHYPTRNAPALQSTMFQACFDNRDQILTPKTVLLVVYLETDAEPTAPAAWRFHDGYQGW